MRRFIVLILMILLTACTEGQAVEGEDLVLAAREWYGGLDSAKVEVINDATGEAEQTFIFKYDEKDIMVYSYIGTGEGIELRQYNNGREQFTYENGETTELTVADGEFTAYSRDIPYPMADEGLLIYFKRAIAQSEVIYPDDSDNYSSGMLVHHVYNPEKLGTYDGEGTLTGFEAYYLFDDGQFVSLREVTTVTLEDGGTETYSYTVIISDENSVEKVENVVDIAGIDK